MMRQLMFAAGLLLAGHAAADPFTLPKGSTQLSFFASVWEIDAFFDGDGNDQELGFDITQTDFQLGLDHGLSDRLTLRLALPWARSERDVVGDDDGTLAINDGVSDARFGLTWRLNDLESPVAVSLLVGVKWPGDYESDIINSPGDGNFDAELVFSLGRQFDRGSIAAEVGYRARSGGPEDEFLGRLEASALLGTRFVVLAVVDAVDQQGGIGIDEDSGIFFPYSLTEEDQLRLTLSGLISFSARTSLFFGWASTLDGTSTAQGSQWALGTVFSF